MLKQAHLNGRLSSRSPSVWCLGLFAVVVFMDALAAAGPVAASSTMTWASPLTIDERSHDPWGVSCPSSGLCVVVDSAGSIVSSTDPAGGAAAWHLAHVDNHWLSGLSCASTEFCVAVDGGGDVVTSTDPTGGVGAWTVTPIAEGPLEAVSCPSASLCVAIDGTGDVFSSSNPTGGARAWSAAHVGDNYLSGVSCVSEKLCVLTDDGNVVTSSNPTEPSTWTGTYVDAGARISCTSAGLCVTVGGKGYVVASTNPTGGPGAWRATYVEGLNRLAGVSCATAGYCVATSYDGNGSAGNVIVSTDPTGSAEAWTETNVYNVPIFPPDPILELYEIGVTGVSCTSGEMCVAVDTEGRAMVGTLMHEAPPVSLSSPVASGVPTVGQLLSCANGSWTGYPPPTFTYQWLRDGTPIGTATTATYTVQAGDQGRSLLCGVTASNSSGSMSAMSNTLRVLSEQGSGGGSSGSGGASASNKGGVVNTATHETRFALARVRSIASNGAIRLGLRLPGPGKLQIVAKADIAGSAAHTHRGTTLLVAQRRLRARSAGEISVTLLPAGRARALLAKHHTLMAIVTITYTPSAGMPGTIRRAVIFRLRRH